MNTQKKQAAGQATVPPLVWLQRIVFLLILIPGVVLFCGACGPVSADDRTDRETPGRLEDQEQTEFRGQSEDQEQTEFRGQSEDQEQTGSPGQSEGRKNPGQGEVDPGPDVIYTIAGVSPGVTGKAWQDMLVWRQQAVEYAASYRGQLCINASPADNKIYLTFDDGPGRNTPQIIATLKDNNATATFFCTGTSMQAWPDLVRQIDDSGFPIGLHGWDHKRFTGMTESELRRQIEQSNELLFRLTGKTTALTRPPYGDISGSVLEDLAAFGQKTFLWSIDTLDWAQKDPADILLNIQNNLRPGDIILMHCGDGQPHTARILPEIIRYIRDQGYEFGQLTIVN